MYSACLTTKGYSVVDEAISPLDGVTLLFGVDSNGRSDAETTQDVDACSDRYWRYVSAAYQSTAPPHMDEGLRQALLGCMRKGGYRLTGDEATVAAFSGEDAQVNGQPSKRARAAEACFTEEAYKLFPDLPWLFWGAG